MLLTIEVAFCERCIYSSERWTWSWSRLTINPRHCQEQGHRCNENPLRRHLQQNEMRRPEVCSDNRTTSEFQK
ncbi:hypothetical protein Mapa_008907 [Marchantia paleacea]|nr:hypothetical protein Mapa_008907 [Marchantia paleacea]